MRLISILLSCFLLGLSVSLEAQVRKAPLTVPSNKKAGKTVEQLQAIPNQRYSIPPAVQRFQNMPQLQYKSINATTSRVKNEPQLKVSVDPENELAIQIKGRLTNPIARQSTEERSYDYLNAIRSTIQIDAPEKEFVLRKKSKDKIGQTHLRMEQVYQNIPVYGAEVLLHEKEGAIFLFNGRYFPTPRLSSLTPSIAQATAETVAKEAVSEYTSFKTLSPQEQQLLPQAQLKSELVIYHKGLQLDAEKLVWHISVMPNLVSRWEYFVDAHTGKIIHHYSSVCKFFWHDEHQGCKHHATNDVTVAPEHLPTLDKITGSNILMQATANALDLHNENQLINTFQVGSTYHLYDGSRTMFNNGSQVPEDPKGMILTLRATPSLSYNYITSNSNSWNDKTAVSAHHNGGVAYEYFANTFNRNSIDGSGGNIISLINVLDENGQEMDNAFWNGQAMFYGDGDQAFNAPLAKASDVAGHEMSHGVIQAEANLEYEGQSGALNESFADVFGAMIDREDWKIGEEISSTSVFPTGTMRDMQNPNNGGNSNNFYWQPDHMDDFQNLPNTPQGDNGGVHINSGIPNHAFYLLATEIGKSKAERIYYTALTDHLSKSSQFIDQRNAVIQAAEDLYGTTEVNAAKNAFNQVGIGEGAGTNNEVDVNINPGDDFVLTSNASLTQINLYNGQGNFVQTISNTPHLSKPSLSDDGTIVVFIDASNEMREIDLIYNGANIDATEYVLDNQLEWRNVAVSRDGNRLAAITNDLDNKIYVYDFNITEWNTFDLYNPTTADPNTSGQIVTGDVEYADALEFDFSGEYVMYDAFNQIESNTGFGDIEYWDIGFLHVWDQNTWHPNAGSISKLFSALPDDTSVGNPSFSKNSPYIICFDWIDNANSVYAANIEQQEIKKVFDNNTLGYPNYSRLDDQMIFTFLENGDEIVILKEMANDKISPLNNDEFYFVNDIPTSWGVWYGAGERPLNTVDPNGTQIGLQLSPNPFSTELAVEWETQGANTANVELINILGMQVYQQKHTTTQERQKISLSFDNLARGTYVLKITQGNKIFSRKVLKL